MKYAIEILNKHKKVCEMSLISNNGIVYKNSELVINKKVLKDIRAAIKLLDSFENSKKKGIICDD